MIQKTKTKLALAAFLAVGINTVTYADGHEAGEKVAIPTVAADPSVTECKEATAPIIPDGNVASEDELLAAQRAFKTFQASTEEYRDCLLVLKANTEAMDLDADELEAKLADNLALDNLSVDKIEAVAEEFNKAVRAFKAR